MNNGKSSIRLTLIAVKCADTVLNPKHCGELKLSQLEWTVVVVVVGSLEQLQTLIIPSLRCWSSSNKTDDNGQAETDWELILSPLKANLSVWAGESAQPGSQWEDRKLVCRGIDQSENSIWQLGDSRANRRPGELETSG